MALRVLIADDDPLILLDLKQMLQTLGYEVVAEAEDGSEAIRLAQETIPDVCVLDVKMPIIDGIDVAEKLTNEMIAPVVLLTAYSDATHVNRAKEAGVFGYLTKPYKPSDLAPAIELARSRYEQNGRLNSEVKSLQERLEVKRIVEQAKGVLMARDGINEAEAYRYLQQESMNKRVSMKELAESILKE